MKLTNREEVIWEELQEWRQTFYEYDATDLENSYDKWVDQAFTLLPESLQIQLFEKLDTWLFHLNSLLRGSKLQNEASERIFTSAKSMDENVHSFSDMRKMPISQLTFLADQQAARHRIYSLIQGGMTGTGQPLLVSGDFLAMIVINLRVVQLTAMSFGYDVQSPSGLLETLKVFNTSMMPERMKMFGWEDLMEDLQKEDEQFYLDIHERITDQSCIDEPLKQLLKISLIMMFSKKTISGKPLISMAIGAGVNYQCTRKVTNFALKYYQYKHLLEKNGGL